MYPIGPFGRVFEGEPIEGVYIPETSLPADMFYLVNRIDALFMAFKIFIIFSIMFEHHLKLVHLNALLSEVFATAERLAQRLQLSGHRVIVNAGTYQDVEQLHFHLVSGPIQVD